MKKITLKNDFHNTEIKVFVPDHLEGIDAYYWLIRKADREYHTIWGSCGQLGSVSSGPAYRRLKKVQDSLCGVTGCTCDTVRGEQ